jgi:hypothetical protein
MGGIFDVVAYMARTDETTRTLQVHPTDKVTAKTRIGGLPPVLTNPTFDDILSAFDKEGK